MEYRAKEKSLPRREWETTVHQMVRSYCVQKMALVIAAAGAAAGAAAVEMEAMKELVLPRAEN
jgi:hypothetical protein